MTTVKKINLFKRRTQDTTGMAGQWQLMWWRFRKHKLALISSIIVLLIYVMALFCEFLATSLPATYSRDFLYAPPQRIKFLAKTETGTKLQLHVNGYNVVMNQEATGRIRFEPSSRATIHLSIPSSKFPSTATCHTSPSGSR